MSIAKWCVLVACVLPVLTVGIAKAAARRGPGQSGAYDNHHPREWEAKLKGWQQRAHAAQLNGFEALPLFIAAVLFAELSHVDAARIDLLAMAFVATRVAYVAAYIMNLATLRSLIWTAGLAINIGLLGLAT